MKAEELAVIKERAEKAPLAAYSILTYKSIAEDIPKLVAEVERLRKDVAWLGELWRYASPDEIFENLPRISELILNGEEGLWIP